MTSASSPRSDANGGPGSPGTFGDGGWGFVGSMAPANLRVAGTTRKGRVRRPPSMETQWGVGGGHTGGPPLTGQGSERSGASNNGTSTRELPTRNESTRQQHTTTAGQEKTGFTGLKEGSTSVCRPLDSER